MKRKPMYPPKAERDWLTEREAADYLGLTHSGLVRLRREGIGPRYYRVGTARGIRYRKADLNEWIEKRTRGVA